MGRSRSFGRLRRIAAWLIRGPEAQFILTDLDDAMERDLARGLSRRRAGWRYVVNVVGSALSTWRAAWRWPRLIPSGLDVKLGLRMLVKQPIITGVSIVALGIGIPVGLVPAHFVAAVEAPLPFDEGERVLGLRHLNTVTSREETPSWYDFGQWRQELTAFAALGAAKRGAYNVHSDDGRTAPVPGAEVTASTFGILRVRPFLGRTLIAGDEAAGAPPVVVVGYDLWRSRLGADTAMVGRTMQIGRVPHTVVGVMPQGFLFPSRDQLWVPLRRNALVDRHEPLRATTMYGRLRDGVSRQEAQTELTTIGLRLAGENPDPHQWLQPEVVPFSIGYFGLPKGGFRSLPAFYGVQVLTLLVLVVACANVAMLILARTASRSGELAVRTALGASRARIVSQVFTEALVFAVVAAGAGLLLADRVAVRFDWLEQLLPFWVDLGVTPHTAMWALSLAVFSAAAISVIPALKVTGSAVQRNIQRATAGRSGIRFGGVTSALLIADVTLAVATVGIAVGLGSGLSDDQDAMPVPTEQYLSAQLRIPQGEPDGAGVGGQSDVSTRVGAIQQEVVRRVTVEPGIRGVTVASVLPGMDHPGRRVELDGEAASELDVNRVFVARVDVGFFEAFERPVVAGRGFEASDLDGGRRVVVVNTTFADRVLGGRNPLGRRVRYTTSAAGEPGPWHEIIGVVGSLGMNTALPEWDVGLYHPLAPGDLNPLYLAIHVGREPTAFTPRLRGLVRDVDPSALISDPMALNEVFSFNAFTKDWALVGAGALIGILIGLSVSGIYALMSFALAQRTRELGIRTALGASKRRIAFTLTRRAFAQLGAGALLGMPIAARLVLELRGADQAGPSPLLITLLAGVGVTILIGVLACTLPTLRALRIVPTEALRSGG